MYDFFLGPRRFAEPPGEEVLQKAMALVPKSKSARMVASELPMATLSRVTGASSSSALREELYRPGAVETVYGQMAETVSIGGGGRVLQPFRIVTACIGGLTPVWRLFGCSSQWENSKSCDVC